MVCVALVLIKAHSKKHSLLQKYLDLVDRELNLLVRSYYNRFQHVIFDCSHLLGKRARFAPHSLSGSFNEHNLDMTAFYLAWHLLVRYKV